VSVGHLAVALGARKVEPAIPLGVAVAAAFGLDLLWPLLLLTGLEGRQLENDSSAHGGQAAASVLSF